MIARCITFSVTGDYAARQKLEIRKMNKTFFIFSSISKSKILLVRETLLKSQFGEFYTNMGRLWRVTDCEELVGVTHRE